MQIERDTYGKLQCHPYPHEYDDSSKQCSHCAFFMGLQRKEGEVIQEGQQFDIRGTVDEFRHSVNMYVFWKPGMDIYVSHVRRKQIPFYVFPDGHKRCRPPRLMSQLHAEQSSPGDEVCRAGSVERRLKRRRDGADVKQCSSEKRQSISPQRRDSLSPEIISGASNQCSSLGIQRTEQMAEINGTEQVHQVEGDKEILIELAKSDQKIISGGVADEGCFSNSSVVTSLTSEVGSCEDTGPASRTGSSEGNPGSVIGSNSHGFSQTDSCEADSELLMNDGCATDGQISEGGSQDELEVLDLSSFCFVLFFSS